MRTIPRIQLSLGHVVILLRLQADLLDWWLKIPTRDQLTIAYLLFPNDTEQLDLLLARLKAEEQGEEADDDDDFSEDDHFCLGPQCCTDVVFLHTYGPKLGKTYGIDQHGHLIDQGYHNRAPGELPPGAEEYMIKGYNDTPAPSPIKDYGQPDELDVFYADRRQRAHDNPIELMDGTQLTECELCGEPCDDEMGEFIQGDKSVIAHGQCGIDAGLDMA